MGKGRCMLLRRAISAWGPNARHLIKLLPLGKIGDGFPFSGFQMHSSCQLDAKVQNEADTRSVSWIYFSRSSTIWRVKFVFLRKLHFVGNMSWPFTSGEQERNIYLFAKIHLNQTIHCRPLLEPALIRCFVKVTRLSLVHLNEPPCLIKCIL